MPSLIEQGKSPAEILASLRANADLFMSVYRHLEDRNLEQPVLRQRSFPSAIEAKVESTAAALERDGIAIWPGFITDPELIELRYPVRLERFAIRKNSGGSGKYRGGDGVVREMLFLQPMSLSVLSQHRAVQPFGVNGGHPGNVGEQFVIKQNGDRHTLNAIDGCEVQTGDRLVLKTPGGGGFGAP